VRDDPAGWAILGSANIAHKYWKAIHMSGNSRVVCVASRDFTRAQDFINECQAQLPFPEAPEAVEGYDAALARDDVHVVYIPLPTALRKEWVLKAAALGKHVLVEKPVGVTTEDVQEMIQACIKVMMEGEWEARGEKERDGRKDVKKCMPSTYHSLLSLAQRPPHGWGHVHAFRSPAPPPPHPACPRCPQEDQHRVLLQGRWGFFQEQYSLF
jgi:hypothetical protein